MTVLHVHSLTFEGLVIFWNDVAQMKITMGWCAERLFDQGQGDILRSNTLSCPLYIVWKPGGIYK